MENQINIDDLTDGLTDEQKRALYVQLAYDYGRPNSKQIVWTDDEQLTWHVICEVLGSQRHLGTTLERAGKTYSRARFADDCDEVLSWLDDGCGQPLTKTQRLALVTDAMQCLARYIRRRDEPVTHKDVLQQLCKLPSAVERAYPGYQECRFLNQIVAFARIAA